MIQKFSLYAVALTAIVVAQITSVHAQSVQDLNGQVMVWARTSPVSVSTAYVSFTRELDIYDEMSLDLKVNLPRISNNPKENYTAEVAHNCEATSVSARVTSSRSRQVFSYDLTEIAKSNTADKSILIKVDRNFTPLPRQCKISYKLIRKDGFNKRRVLVRKNVQVKFKQDIEKRCLSKGILSPDIDRNGMVTPTDVMFVNNRVGTKISTADIDQNGLVTPADVKSVNQRLGCKVRVFKCETDSLAKSPDVDGDGIVTAKDARRVFSHINKNDLSSDLDNDGKVLFNDVESVMNRYGCEL